jgi:hypothetical protein
MNTQSGVLGRAMQALDAICMKPAKSPAYPLGDSKVPPMPTSSSLGRSTFSFSEMTLDTLPQRTRAARLEAVTRWLNYACIRHRRCYSSVTCLHRAYCDWEFAHDNVPYGRDPFQSSLCSLGFLIVDKVSGLILREDFEGLRSYPEVERLLC